MTVKPIMCLVATLAATPAFCADVLPSAAARYAAATDETPDFQKHVVPLLGRLGCNGRACHGSFKGQGNFRLSLFGYDFENDHGQITGDEFSRIDAGSPELSMLLMKPTLEDEHGGGKRMDKGSWQYELLRRWVEAEAPGRTDRSLALTRLDVTPSELIFDAAGETTPLKAVAVWSDGTSEDVTPLCRFQSNDPAVAEVDERGVATSGGAGDTHVVVFYDAGVVPVPVLRPVSDLVGEKYPQVETPTRVDALIGEKHRKLGVVPSVLCTDEEFLRRVYLDLTGTLPPAWEVTAFLADGSPDKRTRKIDELLETPAYAAWWTTRLCDWTGNNPDSANIEIGREQVARDWYDWIEKRVAGNAPYDEIVEGLVLATSREEGESFRDFCENMSDVYAKDATASFADRASMSHYWIRSNFRKPEERAIGFAYTFLGTRIQCAQCHKHPFDRWTQDDFKGFEAFFTRVTYGTPRADKDEYDAMTAAVANGEKGNQLRNKLGQLLARGEVVPLKEVYVVPPRAAAGRRPAEKGKGKGAAPAPASTARVLGGETVDLNEYADARTPLMEWLRSPENPYFARAFANRVWASYFNVGIVDPPDDLNLANPPSNAPLLDHLADGFVASGFDMKWLHREILNSDAYQRSWLPNDTNAKDEKNFSRAVPRRLPAEVAYDALVLATASDGRVEELLADPSKRAIGVPGSGNRYRAGTSGYALTVFGRNIRSSNCDCDRSGESSLLQTVYLRNDQDVLKQLDGKATWIGQIRGALAEAPRPEKPDAEESDEVRRLRDRIAAATREAAAARKKGRPGLAAKAVARIGELRKSLDEAEQAERRKENLARQAEAEAERNSDAPTDVAGLVEQAYLRTLSRSPTDDEFRDAIAYVESAESPIDGVRDLLWALINTKEFIVNH